MRVKLQKGWVNHIWHGLGFDLFKDQTVETKIIEFEGAGYMEENALPTEFKTIQDWKVRKDTIKIREENKNV